MRVIHDFGFISKGVKADVFQYGDSEPKFRFVMFDKDGQKFFRFPVSELENLKFAIEAGIKFRDTPRPAEPTVAENTKRLLSLEPVVVKG